MHSLTIVFGPAATTWTLLFKTEESARLVAAQIGKEGAGKVVDDFGQEVVQLGAIHGIMFEDMDLSQQASIERGVHQARSQAKAQEKAMADPIISLSLRRQQVGPAVLAPGGMPRMS